MEYLAQVSQVPLCNGNGQNDTLIKRPGAKYRGVTYDDIVAMTDAPTVDLKKDKARWVIPSAYVGHDARGHDAQREKGVFWLLPVDIDKGSPSLEQVVGVLRDVFPGAAFVVYSTTSAKPEVLKWRAAIPLAAPIAGADYSAAQEALIGALAERGITADPALARPGQLFYLPNRREFYETHVEPGAPLDWRGGFIADAIQRARMEAGILGEEERWSESAGAPGPVDAFNENNPLPALLARYGYKHARGDHWVSPNSESGSAAVRVYEGGKWVSLSGSDVAAGIGQPSDSGCWGDGFDLFQFYEHGNDRGAAMRAAEKMFPSARKAPPTPKSGAPVGGAPEDEAGVGGDAEDAGDVGFWEGVRFLPSENKFFLAADPVLKMTPGAFDIAHSLETPEPRKGKRPRATAFFSELNVEGRYNIARQVYDPTRGREWTEGSQRLFNLYDPNSVPTPQEGNEGVLLEEAIRGMFTPEYDEAVERFLDFLAHNAQFPGRKVMWAPILIGTNGDGKSTIGEMMKAAMGKENASDLSAAVVNNATWTDWADGKALGIYDEATVSRHEKRQVAATLKNVITEDSLQISKRNVGGVIIRNRMNLMLFSNDDDAVMLDDADRRFLVLRTRFNSAADLLAAGRDTAFFARLRDIINNKPGVVRKWLLDRDLSAFDPYARPPETAAKGEMKAAGRSALAEAIHEWREAHPDVCVVRSGVVLDWLIDRGRVRGGTLSREKVGKALSKELGFRGISKNYRLDDGATGRIMTTLPEEPTPEEVRLALQGRF